MWWTCHRVAGRLRSTKPASPAADERCRELRMRREVDPVFGGYAQHKLNPQPKSVILG